VNTADFYRLLGWFIFAKAFLFVPVKAEVSPILIFPESEDGISH